MRDQNVEPVKLAYDELAPTYDRRWQKYVQPTLRSVIEAIGVAGHERVLDIACGTGELERLLLAQWPDLTLLGADLSLGMLARAKAKEPGGSVAWVQADARWLAFRDGYFDRVVCANSFHYFRSPAKVLSEVRRVLGPDGRFVLVDWCDDYLSCKACSAWLRWTDPAFYKTYSLMDCQLLLSEAGFEVIEMKRFRIDWLWGLMRLVGRVSQSPG
jgi:ubiquinone/menaquinone biosynthesis C-methylase UbiE